MQLSLLLAVGKVDLFVDVVREGVDSVYHF
jgi:hypothetical protein